MFTPVSLSLELSRVPCLGLGLRPEARARSAADWAERLPPVCLADQSRGRLAADAEASGSGKNPWAGFYRDPPAAANGSLAGVFPDPPDPPVYGLLLIPKASCSTDPRGRSPDPSSYWSANPLCRSRCLRTTTDFNRVCRELTS